MTKIVLYDALSYLRVRMETEKPHDLLKGVVNESQNNHGTRIWVWDGPGGNGARRKIFPAYKSTREHNPANIANMDFIRELLAMTGVWQVRVPGFEGDDVIAALTKHFLATTALPIDIQCRDGDLTALCDLSPRVTCSQDSKIPFRLIRLYKTCVGDPSDDIPGIKGFGKGGWEKADKAALKKIVDQVCTWGALSEKDEAAALAAGLSKSSFNWLCSEENATTVAIMRRIIDPLPVSQELINTHLTRQQPDMVGVFKMMERYML